MISAGYVIFVDHILQIRILVPVHLYTDVHLYAFAKFSEYSESSRVSAHRVRQRKLFIRFPHQPRTCLLPPRTYLPMFRASATGFHFRMSSLFTSFSAALFVSFVANLCLGVCRLRTWAY